LITITYSQIIWFALGLPAGYSAVVLIRLVFGMWRAGQGRKRVDARALERYRGAVHDLDRWCGHASPHARIIAAHLTAIGEGQGLNAGTPCGEEPCTVGGLRDQLARIDRNSTTDPRGST